MRGKRRGKARKKESGLRYSLSKACSRMALGDPEKYYKRLVAGLCLIPLPLTPLLLDVLIRSGVLARFGIELPIPLTLTIPLPKPISFPLGFLALPLAIPVLILILVGYYPVLKLKSHLSALEKEAPFSVLAVCTGAYAGLPPLRAFGELVNLPVLEHTRYEVSRILRDATLNRRHLSEQLIIEARGTGGSWGRLLRALISLERTGGDPKLVLRDLMRETLRDLRVSYDILAGRFRSMISACSVVFGAMPMMLTVLFTILASEIVIPLVLGFVGLNIVIAVLYSLVVDAQVPRTISYLKVYKYILLKWAPLGVGVGVLSYFGLIRLPILVVAHTGMSLALGVLAFSIPAYIEFKVHARAVDEILENLPLVLRDLADEVSRGFSPHLALERLHENAVYGKYTDRLIALLVKRGRVQGSLRDALKGIEKLMPVQLRLSLWLVVNGEELGATPDVYNELADTMLEYSMCLRGFKRSCESYRYLGIGMCILSIGLVLGLFATLISRIATIGALMRDQAGGVVPAMPFMIASPEQLPMIKNVVYFGVVANSIVLAVTTGKTLDWRFGGSFRDMVIVTAVLILAVVLGVLMGWL